MMSEEQPILFQNDQVNTENIPGTNSLEYVSLDKNYKFIIIVNRAIFFLMMTGSLVILYFLDNINGINNNMVWISMGILVFFVISLVFGIIGFNYKGYALRERDILYKRGWLWRKITIVPFNRVQHCELNQGPLEKFFKLAKLDVYTAGGNSSELNIPGLPIIEAEKIREYLLKKINEQPLSNS